MDYYAPPLARLIEEFERLPGIGRKTAQRLAFFVLQQSAERVNQFAKALTEAKKNIQYCSVCQNLTDSEVCGICGDQMRDQETVCVVEEPKDVVALERTNEYKGVYHVLHGALSPMEGIGPDSLKIKELLERLKTLDVNEVIMATNSDVEGEATAMYLGRLLKPLVPRVTRLAYGIPVGGELEYADEMTLSRALDGRREF